MKTRQKGEGGATKRRTRGKRKKIQNTKRDVGDAERDARLGMVDYESDRGGLVSCACRVIHYGTAVGLVVMLAADWRS